MTLHDWTYKCAARSGSYVPRARYNELYSHRPVTKQMCVHAVITSSMLSVGTIIWLLALPTASEPSRPFVDSLESDGVCRLAALRDLHQTSAISTHDVPPCGIAESLGCGVATHWQPVYK